MEDLCDMKWNVIGYALLLIYHFSILVIFAVVSVNNLEWKLRNQERIRQESKIIS